MCTGHLPAGGAVHRALIPPRPPRPPPQGPYPSETIIMWCKYGTNQSNTPNHPSINKPHLIHTPNECHNEYQDEAFDQLRTKRQLGYIVFCHCAAQNRQVLSMRYRLDSKNRCLYSSGMVDFFAPRLLCCVHSISLHPRSIQPNDDSSSPHNTNAPTNAKTQLRASIRLTYHPTHTYIYISNAQQIVASSSRRRTRPRRCWRPSRSFWSTCGSTWRGCRRRLVGR